MLTMADLYSLQCITEELHDLDLVDFATHSAMCSVAVIHSCCPCDLVVIRGQITFQIAASRKIAGNPREF